MRRGEILGLKWEDIDFRNGVITLLDTKNGEKREVPMNDTLIETLRSIRRHPSSPYVFCDQEGKRFCRARGSFNTALRRAGIENFRFHDLRHTLGSNLVMQGVELNTVREILGHKSIDMTLRYAHLSPAHKTKAVRVMDSLLRMDTNVDTKGIKPVGLSQKKQIT
jgi:integrase